MVDFTGLGPNAGARIGLDPASAGRLHISNAAPGSVPNALSSAVAAAGAGEKTRADTAGHDSTGGSRKPRDRPHAEAAARSAPPKQQLREGMLTGPPPTFEASLLELETDLKLALARIQAAGYGEATLKSQPDGAAAAVRAEAQASRVISDPATATHAATSQAARPTAAPAAAPPQWAPAAESPDGAARMPAQSAHSDQGDGN
ncbi:hypothetical protein U879_00825 [Defluviimonas sp. 20V17]|uniref:Uncharacterized protein n=1 Tax=Allgaiera indica TaxID=765699 RepID=A0AAN4USX9_9RHOB|nr:hypothetical protein [Allgaiera indica]KDB05576.1 hypothetical protein U879_00825 [Defluviimonas sp. 20V17]GHE03492.1 hypothetical protein GCM10008024_27060 [Allgaiera indica]SDX42985.1 hypothetical protein SAMN05444006_11616 [Allgaiera indica]